MKRETINYEKERITLTVDDVKELLPNAKFNYELYRDYRDEIDIDTLKKCMPDIDNYKKEGKINYADFVNDWRLWLEDLIWERNIDWITNQIDDELRENIGRALEEKNIDYDELNLDFYAGDLYSIDLQLDYILNRSYVKWNLVWHNNCDGFLEGETKVDGNAIEQFLRLFPWAVKEEDLENACNEIYDGSDLKLNFKSTMKDFLDMLESWKAMAYWDAVLHLGVNGSWSDIFRCDAWEVKLDTPYESSFDYWTWEFDWHYGIESVYWPVGWAFNTY